jgi:DNA-binding NarL/FixJ family response regulator
MDNQLGSTEGNGIDLTRKIQSDHPNVHVVSISVTRKLSDACGILHLREGGFDREELLNTIRDL